MKKLFAILLCLNIPSWGAISVVQCVNGGQFGGTGATVSITPANGNTLIAGVSTSVSGDFTSLKDNNSNNFTQDSSGYITGGGTFNGISYYRLSNVSSVTGVTIVWTASIDWGLVICEVSGLAASPVDVMDNTGVGNSATTAWVAHAITTTNANDIVFGLFQSGQGPTFSTSGSWTLGSQSNPAGSWATAMTSQIVASATSWTAAATSAPSSTGGGIAASYKAAVSAGGISKSQKLMRMEE